MRLIELIIAMAIFSTVAGMSMQALLSMRGYADAERIQRMLEIEGKRALDRMSGDLVASAWTPSTATPTTNLSTFPRIWKANDTTRARAVPSSFPYGDTLSFYKLRTEAEISAGSPSALRTENIAFDDCRAANAPTPMSAAATAKPVSSLILNGGWTDTGSTVLAPITAVVWESAQPESADSVHSPSVNYNANVDVTTLRQYRFTVIADTQTGLGILIRQWRNRGSTVDTDWPAPVIGTNSVELCRDVVSISFGSYLTEADEAQAKLNVYQIRIDLMLAATNQSGGRVIVLNSVATDGRGGGGITRQFSSTITLRSVTDPTL